MANKGQIFDTFGPCWGMDLNKTNGLPVVSAGTGIAYNNIRIT